ncbi:cadmium-translocating P-type ATPase [Ligilactobacillus agilis]|uniref:Cd(2+)-exporting ATPase n=1 Tax=Ligilactobacillus agilis TaxID=1601 RepID=A0A231PX71_9LACO|nr:heavy metal translocating P-type ATPase [Ligilactobacillus agilis]OXC07753.1 cadmium-translocating P-type ATPase [Ligilactobacillus agilis]OXC11082.1 cadmium-translocating P-type ATPase [Ligilactobacillus agilis]OXC11602.1 cadmium-translocating P-type ATPase [Ligilactobacillus agilis]OXS39098.1 ATPase P [Ligilactobacillus agilis]OXS42014.1 ATPase P [Ligilactobacillus agilis]
MVLTFKQLTKEERLDLSQIGLSLLLVVLARFCLGDTQLAVIVYIGAYLVAGFQIIVTAAKNIWQGDWFDENFLMTLATLGALLIKQYPEACAVMIFYRLGEFFQERAVAKSQRAITSLLDLRPDFARLAGQSEQIDPAQVKVGQVISVLPGERIPLDGIVTQGTAYLDTAALTGESKPRPVTVGQEVLSGMVVLSSSIELRVTKSFGQSTVSKLLDLVQNSSQQKAQTENFIRRFAKRYTPVVVLLALVLALLGPLVSGGPFQTWLYRACVFLVISCPCALVISIPLGFFGGIGAASRAGVLIKGSNYLEALTKVTTIVYDKTGTLTEGKFKVSQVLPVEPGQAEKLITLAALAEKDSPHPVAQAIVANFPGNIATYKVDQVEQLVGLGVKALYEGHTIFLGNARLMEKQKIAYQAVAAPQATVCYLAYDGVYLGAILVADELKKTTKQALANLKKLGIKQQLMLTGDNQQVATKVASELGIAVKSELLPQAKVAEVAKLKEQLSPTEKLAFVGDGLNDTPVLKQADIGIAMGALGSDAAIEAADIVLMNDELLTLTQAILIARKTKRIVWENISFALIIKALFLLLGLFGLTTMWVAVFADVGVTLLAVANALRLVLK